ncbi:MAG: hypothetical protein IKB35_03075 [Clostridia bacterium]|nr:hypothetical protein [Clostridia bacterium]
MYNTLNKLLKVTALASGEKNITSVIGEMMADCCDKTYTDPLGNLICVKYGSGENKQKIMLSAHADECGFAVTFVNEDGTLLIDASGEADLTSAAYGDVVFENGTRGILIPDSKELSVRKMHIDIGAKNRADAYKKVREGDFCAPAHRLLRQNGKFIGTALDSRVPCAILIKAAHSIEAPENDIYYVFTAHETVGSRGAYAAAVNVAPHIAITVSLSDASVIKAGKLGVRYKDTRAVCDRALAENIENIARSISVPTQSEINTKQNSDAFAVQSVLAGARVSGISISAERLNTSAETVNIKDCEAAIKLCTEIIGGKNEL